MMQPFAGLRIWISYTSELEQYITVCHDKLPIVRCFNTSTPKSIATDIEVIATNGDCVSMLTDNRICFGSINEEYYVGYINKDYDKLIVKPNANEFSSIVYTFDLTTGSLVALSTENCYRVTPSGLTRCKSIESELFKEENQLDATKPNKIEIFGDQVVSDDTTDMIDYLQKETFYNSSINQVRVKSENFNRSFTPNLSMKYEYKSTLQQLEDVKLKEKGEHVFDNNGISENQRMQLFYISSVNFYQLLNKMDMKQAVDDNIHNISLNNIFIELNDTVNQIIFAISNKKLFVELPLDSHLVKYMPNKQHIWKQNYDDISNECYLMGMANKEFVDDRSFHNIEVRYIIQIQDVKLEELGHLLMKFQINKKPIEIAKPMEEGTINCTSHSPVWLSIHNTL